LQYHVVGGFSFYERAEIKDMISYLKVLLNPDDSIALQRVINTPARGIGKTPMETLERIALETGTSLWGAASHVVDGLLAPPRAVASLKGFREIIEGGRAMLAGSFTTWLGDAADASQSEVEDRSVPGSPDSEEIAAAAEADDANFTFGWAEHSGSADEDQASPEELAGPGAIALPDSDEEADSGAAASGEGPRPANTAELLKYLIDRTGYIRQLEEEDTPDAYARIENLRELVNAAMDSRDRGESLQEFLDHAALVSDQDSYDERAKITLMSLHAAKGLEFPLVFLVGLEEGLFPHSRTFLNPDDVEEERRLCYVGMTRAMDALVLSRARYRRRYGTDLPEASVPSRFLEEVPPQLLEDLGSPRRPSYAQPRAAGPTRAWAGDDYFSTHYDYENEDQTYAAGEGSRRAAALDGGKRRPSYTGPTYNSIDNIAEFFASRGKRFTSPKVQLPEPTGKRGFRPGQRVRHPKYGEGTVFKREGEGDDAKITVQFPGFGLKKLVEKYAQLEKA